MSSIPEHLIKLQNFVPVTMTILPQRKNRKKNLITLSYYLNSVINITEIMKPKSSKHSFDIGFSISSSLVAPEFFPCVDKHEACLLIKNTKCLDGQKSLHDLFKTYLSHDHEITRIVAILVDYNCYYYRIFYNKIK